MRLCWKSLVPALPMFVPAAGFAATLHNAGGTHSRRIVGRSPRSASSFRMR